MKLGHFWEGTVFKKRGNLHPNDTVLHVSSFIFFKKQENIVFQDRLFFKRHVGEREKTGNAKTPKHSPVERYFQRARKGNSDISTTVSATGKKGKKEKKDLKRRILRKKWEAEERERKKKGFQIFAEKVSACASRRRGRGGRCDSKKKKNKKKLGEEDFNLSLSLSCFSLFSPPFIFMLFLWRTGKSLEKWNRYCKMGLSVLSINLPTPPRSSAFLLASCA